jgi:hypothetical protein
MNHIRRAFALTDAAAMAAMVTVAASACGGATTATGPPDNGLEKSPAEVLRAAAAALRAARSVHIVGSDWDAHFDTRMQGSSAIGTIRLADRQIRIRVIGGYGYEKIDRGHNAGRWLKYPLQPFKQFTLAEYASNPFSGYGPLEPKVSGYGPLEPKVQQATVNGRKVVVVSWRNGSKLYVANTGPACPLRAKFKGQYPSGWCSASTTSRLTSPHQVTPSTRARLASSTGRPDRWGPVIARLASSLAAGQSGGRFAN